MSVVLTQEMPGVTRELIEQVTAEMHFETTGPPAGLIVHTAMEVEGGIRIVDVWESADAYATFGETRLGPALQAVAERNGLALDEMPEMTPVLTEAFDTVRA
jgi:hypothetical protein